MDAPRTADGSADLGHLRAALADPDHVALPGFHALKHALRFGADIRGVAVRVGTDLSAIADALAPDLLQRLRTAPVAVTSGQFRSLLPHPPGDGVVAVARRPQVSVAQVLAVSGPVVVLDRPRNPGNTGAAIRVTAAAGGGGLLVVDGVDPWHAATVRGAAGLQFAVPVARSDRLPVGTRPVVACADDGIPLEPGALPPGPLLVFGSERHGISAETRAAADVVVAIPMRADVSSLNLATAVAVTLYALRGLGPTPSWT